MNIELKQASGVKEMPAHDAKCKINVRGCLIGKIRNAWTQNSSPAKPIEYDDDDDDDDDDDSPSNKPVVETFWIKI